MGGLPAVFTTGSLCGVPGALLRPHHDACHVSMENVSAYYPVPPWTGNITRVASVALCRWLVVGVQCMYTAYRKEGRKEGNSLKR